MISATNTSTLMQTIQPKSPGTTLPKTSLKPDLKIVADEKILQVSEAFSTIGKVVKKSGNEITASDLENADALLTRTTTKVHKKLLEHSAVKFVASATAGTDHIDLDYLSDKGIGFTSAPGCNSVAVGEYVVNALLRLAAKKSIDLSGKTLGIIGAGHAGSALKRIANCLGIQCLLNDPPLSDISDRTDLIPLDDLIAESDIISLHVPLTHTGLYPTYHLIDRDCLAAMKPNSILVNSSRGGVIDELELENHSCKFDGIILDVWEGEPAISLKSLAIADIATPHIAGYSLDGKFKATEIIYRETCSYFDLTPTWISPRQSKSTSPVIDLQGKKLPLEQVLTITYNIFADDKRLRKVSVAADPINYFRSLRGEYDFRQEFSNFQLTNYSGLDKATIDSLKRLGFIF